MNIVTITAPGQSPESWFAEVLATHESTGVTVAIGAIARSAIRNDWHAFDLVYGERKGAAMDVARRHFAIDGRNDPTLKLVWGGDCSEHECNDRTHTSVDCYGRYVNLEDEGPGSGPIMARSEWASI